VLKFRGNFEVIIVNDGSTDSSIEVIEKYIADFQPTNVKIFSTENLGSAHARNFAIEQSMGEFLLFLDSDDQLVSETIQDILDYDLLENDFDAERFSYRTRVGPIVESIGANSTDLLLHQKGFWRYLYRREFIIENRIRFLPNFVEARGFYILDDWYFLLQFLAFNPKLRFSELILYSYNNREKDMENEFRYLKQIELEHNALRILGKNLQQAKKVNFEFLFEALYSRAYMICRLLNPRPKRSSRVRLLKALILFLFQVQIRNKSRYLLRIFMLFLRTL
jgi:glycosyltransferase involved in cell wall biosynthesis